jgi:peptide/nickel transport system ATP-binding protein
MSEPPALLQARGLRVAYGTGRKSQEVLHGIDLEIASGETVGLVGESGSGKTTLGRAVLGLVKVAGGTLNYEGREITDLGPRGRRALARDIQVVFQDPYTSLNPALKVRDVLTEPMRAQGVGRSEANRRVSELLDRVGMPSDALDRYAREFSGGQRQRIAIARALALDPRLIVCDEPVSALDLSTQLRVLDLLIELQQRTGVAYLFISHDLSVVRHISHRVAVLYKGEIVELGEGRQVTEHPQHAYTRRLWAANLVADPVEQARRRELRRELG